VLNKPEQAAELHTMRKQFWREAHCAICEHWRTSDMAACREELDTLESDYIEVCEMALESRNGFHGFVQLCWDEMKQRHAIEIARHKRSQIVAPVARSVDH
jgi:hypothetical protein